MLGLLTASKVLCIVDMLALIGLLLLHWLLGNWSPNQPVMSKHSLVKKNMLTPALGLCAFGVFIFFLSQIWVLAKL